VASLPSHCCLDGRARGVRVGVPRGRICKRGPTVGRLMDTSNCRIGCRCWYCYLARYRGYPRPLTGEKSFTKPSLCPQGMKRVKVISRQSSCSRSDVDATIRCVLRIATYKAAVVLVCVCLGCQSRTQSRGNSTTKSDCPLVIERVSFRQYAGGQYNTLSSAMLFFEVRNMTGKTVRSALFVARAERDRSVSQSLAVPDTATLSVPPHSAVRFSRPMPLQLSSHPLVSVLQVGFNDGTGWYDNGSLSCSRLAD
jgi:hypothetical protein